MRRWLAGLLVPLALLAPALLLDAEPPARDVKSKTAHVLDGLGKPIDFPSKDDANLIDQKTTLGEILENWTKRYDLQFRVDEAAFAAAAKDEDFRLLEQKVLEKAFPKMIAVPFENVLQSVLARVRIEGGATFVVDRGTILLTTVPAQRARIWGKAHKEPYPAVIHANFERVPLAEALQDIATKGNVTLIVSDVIAEKMRMPVTTQLINAPLDTAAAMLADIADFRAVFKDNLLYITTRENATLLEKEFQKRGRPSGLQPAVPSTPPRPEPRAVRPWRPEPAEEGVKEARKIVLQCAEGDADAMKKGAEELVAKKIALKAAMTVFKLWADQGVGVGDKTGSITPDGIEAKLISLAKKELPAATAQKEGPALEKAAHVALAMSYVVEAYTPQKKVGDKDPRDWMMYTRDMRDAAKEFAGAAKKADPKGIQAAAKNLTAACNSCHGVFRD
jgi:hypothetical protein